MRATFLGRMGLRDNLPLPKAATYAGDESSAGTLEEDDASNAGGEGEGTRLRLAVEGGGCSGFKYEFTLEREGDAEGGDRVFRAENGAEVVVDDVSYEFVRGATIDYVDEMIKSSFEVVKNPQADASCGCGASFGAKESAFGALGGQT